MINLHELEARHRRYKAKQRRPYYFAILTIFALLGIGFFLWSIAPQIREKTQAKPLIDTIPIATPIENVVEEPNITTQTPIEEKPLEVLPKTVAELTPDFSFIRTIDTNVRTIATPPPTVAPTPPSPKTSNTPKPLPSTPPESAPLSLSSTQNSSQTITQLITRFESNKNAQLGIVIAQYYYDKKEYSKAYSYAFEANAINQNDPQSWIIAAQSLYKLNKKEDAKKLLRLFTNSHNHPQANALLISMEKGTFK